MNKSTKPITQGILELTNIETKESLEYEFKSKDTKQHNNYFHVIWLNELSKLLKSIGNQKIKVLCYILDNMDTSNKLISSIRKIAKELNVSSKTVGVAIKTLKDIDYIRQVQEGVYMLNPNLLLRGNYNRKEKLLKEYYKLVINIEEEANKDFLELANSY